MDGKEGANSPQPDPLIGASFRHPPDTTSFKPIPSEGLEEVGVSFLDRARSLNRMTPKIEIATPI